MRFLDIRLLSNNKHFLPSTTLMNLV